MIPKPIRILSGALALALFLISGALCAGAQPPDPEGSPSADSAKINELFHNIRQHAILAEADAELLDSYTRSRVSWQSHARRIESMRSHVKDLADDFNQAATLRSEGSPWQQEAIDHLQPLLQGMADHMKATIDHLSQNQSRTNMKPWLDYVRANREYAIKTADLIRDYVSYGEARATVDDLEKKLEIPAAPTAE